MIQNRYPGICSECGERVAAGEGLASKPRYARRWRVRHRDCGQWRPSVDPEVRAAQQAQARDDAEYARGQRDAERWQFNRRMFGEDYANAEELAWELKDPDPAY